MQKFTFTLPDYLHLYLAKSLSEESSLYTADIKLSSGTKAVNAKNLFSIMALDAEPHTSLTFTAEGKDEQLAISQLSSLINAILPAAIEK